MTNRTVMVKDEEGGGRREERRRGGDETRGGGREGEGENERLCQDRDEARNCN